MSTRHAHLRRRAPAAAPTPSWPSSPCWVHRPRHRVHGGGARRAATGRSSLVADPRASLVAFLVRAPAPARRASRCSSRRSSSTIRRWRAASGPLTINNLLGVVFLIAAPWDFYRTGDAWYLRDPLCPALLGIGALFIVGTMAADVHAARPLRAAPDHASRSARSTCKTDFTEPLHVPVLLAHRVRRSSSLQLRQDAAAAPLGLPDAARLHPGRRAARAERVRRRDGRPTSARSRKRRQLGRQREPLRVRDAARDRVLLLPRRPTRGVVGEGSSPRVGTRLLVPLVLLSASRSGFIGMFLLGGLVHVGRRSAAAHGARRAAATVSGRAALRWPSGWSRTSSSSRPAMQERLLNLNPFDQPQGRGQQVDRVPRRRPSRTAVDIIDEHPDHGRRPRQLPLGAQALRTDASSRRTTRTSGRSPRAAFPLLIAFCVLFCGALAPARTPARRRTPPSRAARASRTGSASTSSCSSSSRSSRTCGSRSTSSCWSAPPSSSTAGSGRGGRRRARRWRGSGSAADPRRRRRPAAGGLGRPPRSARRRRPGAQITRTAHAVIRIEYFIDHLKVGGAQRHLVELFAGLDRRRFAPQVCVGEGGGALVPVIERLGIPVRSFGVRREPGAAGDGRPVALAHGAAAAGRAACTSCTAISSRATSSACSRGASPACPVRLASKRSLDRYPRRSQRLATRLANALADRVVCNADAVRASSSRRSGPAPRSSRVIPNGIRIPAPPPGVERPGGRAAGARRSSASSAGSAGRRPTRTSSRPPPGCAPRATTSSSWSSATGRCAPSSRPRPTRLGTREHVHFLGEVPRARGLLRGFDVFVISSVIEGMPNVLLEALALERPVVATRVGGIPEIVTARRERPPRAARRPGRARGRRAPPARRSGRGGAARRGGPPDVETRFSVRRDGRALHRALRGAARRRGRHPACRAAAPAARSRRGAA